MSYEITEKFTKRCGLWVNVIYKVYPKGKKKNYMQHIKYAIYIHVGQNISKATTEITKN